MQLNSVIDAIPGGRTLLNGACNVQRPPPESYLNRGSRSRSFDSNTKRGTLKQNKLRQNFTPERVDFLGRFILHKSLE